MTDFLDTVEGPDWLYDAINSLICGDTVTAPRSFGKPVALVTPQSLYEALAEHLGAQEHIAPAADRQSRIPDRADDLRNHCRREPRSWQGLRLGLLGSGHAKGQASPDCLARSCRVTESSSSQ